MTPVVIINIIKFHFIMVYRRRTGRRAYRKNKGRMSRTKKSGTSRYKGFTRTTGAYKRFDAKSYLPAGITRELKFFHGADVLNNPSNLSINGTPLPNGGPYSQNMCYIAQGTKANEREGRKIVISEINLKNFWSILEGTYSEESGIPIRCMLILDTQANGAGFVGSDILDYTAISNYGPPAVLCKPIYCHRNHFNGERFKILMDEFFVLEPIEYGKSAAAPSTTVSNPPMLYSSHMQVKSFKVNIPIIYSDTNTTGALIAVKSNSLSMMFWTDVHQTSPVDPNNTSPIHVECSWELRYYDD